MPQARGPSLYETGYNNIREYVYVPPTEYVSLCREICMLESMRVSGVQGCTSMSSILQRASSESGALAKFRITAALAADALAVRHDLC